LLSEITVIGMVREIEGVWQKCVEDVQLSERSLKGRLSLPDVAQPWLTAVIGRRRGAAQKWLIALMC
jgi:hypothetical protein